MSIYQDLLSGDELLSESFPYTEHENGVLWESTCSVTIDVDIGESPFSEDSYADEGNEDQAIKAVDIVDTFSLQKQSSSDNKQFVRYIKKYTENLMSKLDNEKQEASKKNSEGAIGFLLSKLNDLQFFVGESMIDDAGMVFTR